MFSNRPNIKVSPTTGERWLNRLSIILIISVFGYVAQRFNTLPDTIPIHFDGKGNIDGWGHKGTIFIVPSIMTVMFIGLYFLNKIPHTYNLPVKITELNAAKIYSMSRTMMALFNFEMVLILAYTTYAIIASANEGVSLLAAWYIVTISIGPLGTIIIYSFVMRRVAHQLDSDKLNQID
ncbi:DUF1648 domain-containing protein [Lentibacillus saliphilus]|uniref:DUF1648 domain-containing protein n=1 Tax=Lentibacillus saliphilus TaxID=2737028 RepID=UPI001C2F5D05|nr:DUF1648 domain-containing protein [Lentibacillus saliphilus]